eukprot:TRINITY_DN3664_c0_g2_i2.p1 TRINITY_DN3664_c0_g2~~TRINITY_DN3664_c0_g2_i2.p1  ORF type:complete len:121 (+),score=11.32 TRINITY_DN3664_c0_g2_i2:465-827(+)
MTNDGTFNENNISINLYQIPDKHVGGTTPQLTILINLIQKMSTKTRRCTLPALHLPLTALQNSDTSNVTHFWNDKEKRRKKKRLQEVSHGLSWRNNPLVVRYRIENLEIPVDIGVPRTLR